MLTPFIAGLQATNLQFGAGADWQNINQQRMALANTVTGNETPDQFVRIAQTDKALALQAVQADTQQYAAHVMSQAAMAKFKKDWERKREAIKNGVLFV